MELRSAILGLAFTALSLNLAPTPSLAQESLFFNVSRYVIEGDNPLTEAQALAVVNPYIGQQSGLEGLNAARDALEQELAARGFPFYRVTLPPQELFDGAVIFKIVEFKLGNIVVDGNAYFSEQNILNSIPHLVAEQSPNTQLVSRSLGIANENPAKSVGLSFKAGEVPERIDAVLKVQEFEPQTIYAQLNNTGPKDGDSTRVSIGYQHNALWDLDHGLSLSYTTSPEDTAAVAQWGMTYRIPLYDHGATVNLLLSDSEVDSGLVADSFEVSGSGSVIGADYKRPLFRKGNYSHSYNIGFYVKTFDNNVSFLGTPIGSDIKTQPLSIGYRGSSLTETSQLSFNIDLAVNVAGGGDNDDEDYELVRAGATADWSAVHYGISYLYRFANNTLISLKLKGQQSSDLLVSGEQFGIGGSRSVRGYDERGISGDSGYEASVEYWFNPLYGVRPLVFYDTGKIDINDPEPGQDSSLSISGAGFGGRYSWKDRVSVDLDLAYAMDDSADVTEKGDTRAHVSVLVRF